jgi:hypothetical protein
VDGRRVRRTYEPDLARFLADNTAIVIGQPFRGSSLFTFSDYAIRLTMDNLWVRDIPTANEYHQLVTPQSVYFNYSVLKNDVRGNLNAFFPQVMPTSGVYFKVLPMLGIRYFVVGDLLDPSDPPSERPSSNSGVENYLKLLANRTGLPVEVLPQGAHHNLGSTARWHVYEISRYNVGDYSPTQLTTAGTGAAAAATMLEPNFDLHEQAVVSAPIDTPLVAARNMRMSWIRGGLHLTGRSEGTSLVVLPQQFSHCLRARDGSVHLVRANLMMTGMIFSGDVDTDITFDYGLFTPKCRWADISDHIACGHDKGWVSVVAAERILIAPARAAVTRVAVSSATAAVTCRRRGGGTQAVRRAAAAGKTSHRLHELGGLRCAVWPGGSSPNRKLRRRLEGQPLRPQGESSIRPPR